MFPLPEMLAQHVDRRVLGQIEFALGLFLIVALDAVFVHKRNNPLTKRIVGLHGARDDEHKQEGNFRHGEFVHNQATHKVS